MGAFSFKQVPHEHKTEKYLEKLKQKEYMDLLNDWGQKGVEALYQATPKRTGLTASSWSYNIEYKKDEIILSWSNSNKTKDGDPIAILIQYGHGTGRGTYVKGIDYINPAIKPIFDSIADEIWKAMVSL